LSRTRIIVAIGIVAALLVIAGVATASIPDANGTLHACVKKVGGQVRAIDPSAGQTCNSNEYPETWNLTGLDGAKGSPGPPGLQGMQGDPGSSGYEVDRTQFTADGSGDGHGEVDCPDGKRPLSGGVELSSQLRAWRNRPNDDGTGWVADVTGTANATFAVYAICVDATTP